MPKRAENIGIDVYAEEGHHMVACSKSPDVLTSYADDKFPEYEVVGMAYTGKAELCAMMRKSSFT